MKVGRFVWTLLMMPARWILGWFGEVIDWLLHLCAWIVPCERIIKNELRKTIKRGKLELESPSGAVEVFGSTDCTLCARIKLKNAGNFFQACLFRWDLGFAESYIDGDWTTDDLHQVLQVFAINRGRTSHIFSLARKSVDRLAHLLRANTPKVAQRNISAHYDLSNAFFEQILDPTMSYSAGIFSEHQPFGQIKTLVQPKSLEQAQLDKIDLLLARTRVQRGDHLLEIGSGWGALAVRAAKQLQCRVTSVTLSKEQLEYAIQRAQREGVADLVSFRLLDYRSLPTLGVQFDAAVSCEMIEAVGAEFYPEFFSVLERVTKPTAVVVLQAITIPDQRFAEYAAGCDFIQKHIFPGGLCPSLQALQDAMTDNSGFFVHDLTNYAYSYHKTLECWNSNLRTKRSAITKLDPKFDDCFFKTWEYYFQYCSVGFSCRALNLLHLTLTREGESRIESA